MDLNNYMFQDQMMPSRPGDPNIENTRQWSQDVISREMQWHQPYRIGLAGNYNMQHQIHHQPTPPTLQPGYSIRCPPLDNPRSLAPYQRPVGPVLIGQSMYRYSNVDFSNHQPPVLRQLYPSNDQMCAQPGMQFEVQSTHMMQPAPVLPMPRVIPGSSARPTANRMLELAKPPSAFSMTATNLHAKRPNMGNSTTTTESPNKKMANLKSLLSQAAKSRRIEKKINIRPASPEKQNKTKLQTSITKGVCFVTASVSDVLRWRKNHVFSDSERCNVLIEIVGTVFDIGGIKPVKISVHSQCLIKGIFWETDFRLDRNIILPGCLVKVVLRIPLEGEDFHFLKVSPLRDSSAAENSYRRIAYVTGSAIDQSKKK